MFVQLDIPPYWKWSQLKQTSLIKGTKKLTKIHKNIVIISFDLLHVCYILSLTCYNISFEYFNEMVLI